MNWKEKLKMYEKNKDWDSAIGFMQMTIQNDVEKLDVYLLLDYLLMNLLVEEDYDDTKHDGYANLLKSSFKTAYSNFSEDAQFLFYSGITALMSEWYFDITADEAKEMLAKAWSMDNQNLLYKWGYYTYSDMSANKKISADYAHMILEDHRLKAEIESKGSLGDYVLEMLRSSVDFIDK